MTHKSEKESVASRTAQWIQVASSVDQAMTFFQNPSGPVLLCIALPYCRYVHNFRDAMNFFSDPSDLDKS